MFEGTTELSVTGVVVELDVELDVDVVVEVFAFTFVGLSSAQPAGRAKTIATPRTHVVICADAGHPRKSDQTAFMRTPPLTSLVYGSSGSDRKARQ